MLCSLIERIEATTDLEMIVVGPNADWPKPFLERARTKGIYLGFKPPEEAAKVLAGADALLVVMSFEDEHELFHAHQLYHQISGLRGFRKTCDSLGTRVLHAGPSCSKHMAELSLSPAMTPTQLSVFADKLQTTPA